MVEVLYHEHTCKDDTNNRITEYSISSGNLGTLVSLGMAYLTIFYFERQIYLGEVPKESFT